MIFYVHALQLRLTEIALSVVLPTLISVKKANVPERQAEYTTPRTKIPAVLSRPEYKNNEVMECINGFFLPFPVKGTVSCDRHRLCRFLCFGQCQHGQPGHHLWRHAGGCRYSPILIHVQ